MAFNRLNRPLAASLVCIGWMLVATDADAFKLRIAKGQSNDFNKWREPVVRFNLVPACAPDVDKKQCHTAIHNAAKVWNAAGCGVKLSIATTKAMKNGAAGQWFNGRNDVFWANASWTLGNLAVAYAQTLKTPTGEHLESSVVFNAKHFAWHAGLNSTGVSQALQMPIDSVAVHEFGHVLGLMHSLRNSYMGNSYSLPGEGAPPDDDESAVCFLYSKGKFTCSNSAQCPAIGESVVGNESISKTLVCKKGSCGDAPHRHPLANKAVGVGCKDSFACKPPARCGFRVGGHGVCSTPCATDDDCSGGLSCILAAHSPLGGLCGKGGQPIGKSEAEGACSSNAECISGYCHPHDGTQTCQYPCGGGYQCSGSCAVTPGSSVAVCVLKPIKIGHECAQNITCETGVCGGNPFDKRCVDLCSKDADCGGGFGCHQLGHGGICVRKSGGAPGDVCAEDRFCASGLCVTGVGGKRCRNPCDACPAGESCQSVEGRKACLPAKGKLPLGASCTVNEECATKVCVPMSPGRMCTSACKTTKDCSCGMACEETIGGRFCVPFTPKLCIANGRGCSKDLMCASDRCRDAVCRATCKLFSACPTGQVCRPDLDRPDAGTCEPAGPNSEGDLCSDDEECATGFCPDDRCRVPCDDSHPCAGDSTCTGKLGSLQFCIPEPIVDAPDTTDADTGTTSLASKSDGCSSGPTAPHRPAWLLLVALAVFAIRRRRALAA